MRESQITRTAGVAFRQPDPRSLGHPFWSAMLMDTLGTSLSPYSSQDLSTSNPRHATNGDSDFDTGPYPAVRLIIPFDGIYGVSAIAQFRTYDSGVTEYVTMTVFGADSSIAWDEVHFTGNADMVMLHCHRVGVPLSAGDRVSLSGYNGTGSMLYANVQHLEATYFGPIGTLYPIKGGST